PEQTDVTGALDQTRRQLVLFLDLLPHLVGLLLDEFAHRLLQQAVVVGNAEVHSRSSRARCIPMVVVGGKSTVGRWSLVVGRWSLVGDGISLSFLNRRRRFPTPTTNDRRPTTKHVVPPRNARDHRRPDGRLRSRSPAALAATHRSRRARAAALV